MKSRPSPTSRGFKATFEVDPFRKFCLIEGLDDIGLTLRHAAALDTYEAKHDEAELAESEIAAVLQPARAEYQHANEPTSSD